MKLSKRIVISDLYYVTKGKLYFQINFEDKDWELYLFENNEETFVFRYPRFSMNGTMGDLIIMSCHQQGLFKVDNKTVSPFLKNYTEEFWLTSIVDESKLFLLNGHAFDNKSTKSNPPTLVCIENDLEIWRSKIYGNINHYSFGIINYPNVIPDFIRTEFELHSNSTGKFSWSFDFSNHTNKFYSAYPFDHLLQLQAPIGKYKDQLWFSVTNYGLLCLNFDTGAFMHYFRDYPENDIRFWGLPYGNYPIIPNTENAVLLESEGKIVCFDSWYYWELNLDNLELKFHYLQEYFQEVDCYTFGSRLKKLEVDGDKIYMVSIRTKKFACFNRTTLKYDWIENLPEESSAPKSIERHGNRLYIETTKKELLVYESK